ncbi:MULTISPECIES: ferredoxin-thioredoxin reductase catalytic domain-containing protein [Nitratidesulfovibrio]|uniref:ferredoxin:thioredoxin reductase n=1 Tax=Nitratidesulfovibrio liaohensis TaxID=2604158 RepID=A0ABY9R3V9_9BACT|nr:MULTISPECIES: ferredoxin-thioredoxin reductase catalytic domain-containing protein [Nitratidesulfovibrio]MBZ2171108.1 ferredoxin:thioredoxin reductase [Nitratidesulfovibrio sp. SRB-5]RXF77964.1 ferredoxin:thioredoxin reductase [Desulfovibrio sp. DS-1]WMW65265.1 ferredoxin:thioredoxin reductase [Nitratidesulfovibrio liaohensis]
MSGPATPQALHDMLRKIQEPKGYFFNKDMDMTMPLLESLLVNKQRYGYMACPCRLALGEFEKDRDIVCPCVYREDDVKEFGACFCGLYVSQAWNDDEIPHDIVPERRPPEKLFG